jgi:hypothetical protein
MRHRDRTVSHESDPLPTEAEPSGEEVAQAALRFAATQMASGESNHAVHSALVANGLDKESATTVVTNVAEMRSEAIRERGRKNMLYGLLWLIGGTVVTVGTYAAASGGGTYVVAWGAIVVGAIKWLRGLSQSTHKPRAVTDDRSDDDEDERPPGW